MMWLEEEICSQGKRRNKRVFNYCQTIVLSLPTVGSLVDLRAYKPYTLVGPPVWRPVLTPHLSTPRQPSIYVMARVVLNRTCTMPILVLRYLSDKAQFLGL